MNTCFYFYKENMVFEEMIIVAELNAGYLAEKEATGAILDQEGWLRTGDICYFDEEGFLFYVDRIKELIKYKAYQVYSKLWHLLVTVFIFAVFLGTIVPRSSLHVYRCYC